MPDVARRLAAIVAIDVAGYSRLMGADEEGTLQRLKAHVALGSVHLWEKRHGPAIAEFERVIALDPNFVTGYVRFGWVLHYAGRPKDAIGLIERGMRLDPHYPDDYLHMLAQANFQLGRYEQAIDLLKRRLVLKPDTDISRVLLATSYGHLGRSAEAKAEWAEVLRINPGYSVERGQRVMPYKNPADLERIIAGLRQAGLSA